MSNLKTVKLYGDLGKRFGREFLFDVYSPTEAIRLLAANFKDFTKYFVGDGTLGYHIVVNNQDLSLEQIGHPVSTKEVIKIIPVVGGSGDDPFVNILIGAALIYVAGPAGYAATFGSAATAVVGIGWGLVIGGVAGLLFAPPTIENQEPDESKASTNFDGPVNTTRQGNPVPVGYGRLRVGSQVISLGIRSERVVA